MTPPGAAPSSTPKRRPRRRFWFLLFITLLASAALYPPAWHAALREFIRWQAHERGWNVQVGEIEGGLFDATVLHDVRCRKAFPSPAAGEVAGGVDLRVARAEAQLAWRLPLSNKDASFLRRLTLDGVSGTLDFTSAGAVEPSVFRAPRPAIRTAALTPGFVLRWWPVITAPPTNFELLRVDCRLRRGPVSLRVQGARLTAYAGASGQCLARKVEMAGPGFENTLGNRSGVTAWKDGQLTIADLSLGQGLDLVRVTIDGARLRRRQLDWDSELHALGGSIRSQGTVRFAHGRIGLDIAGSFQQVAVRPLARMLGVDGATDGTVDQGQFSFHGNPEQWTQATISVAGQATDFRWGQRRWESLDLAAIVLHERVTVRKLELRQSRNQLSLSGECPLPSSALDGGWKLDGFTCKVDANFDDLHSLAQLLAPDLPPLAGRMSVNGALTARTGGNGLDGYLNVEGSALTVSGAPLDYLRSTLLFKGEDLQIADVQATRGADKLAGKGTVRIFGTPRYQGELHGSIADLAVYHPAYAGNLSPEPLSGMLQIEWSGDGAPGAHSGAFRGNVANFVATSGPAHFSRPVTLQVEGTYSPESLSFRQFTLRGGSADKPHDAIKLEGAVPWTRDPGAWSAGRWLDFSRPLAVRVAFNEAPLDLIAEAVHSPVVQAADGQVGGWLDVSGTPEAPRANGVLQFRKAGLRVRGEPAIEKGNADVRIEDSVVRLDTLSGERAGASWQAGGSVDLHGPAHPLLDLSFHSARVPGAVDDDFLRADAEVTLTVHGPWQQAEISGDVRLLEATVRRTLAADGEPEPWSVLTAGIPAAWSDDRLALHVTSAKPLRASLGGEFVPDLTVGGTGAAPQLAGTIELRKVRISGAEGDGALVETGQIYLTPSEEPRLQFTLGSGEVWLGSVTDLQRVTVGSDIDAADLLRHATEQPAEEAPSSARLSLHWR